MKKDKLKLYFIALVPDEPVFTEVMNLKTEIKERFGSKAALRSPPHITLHMPFQWQEEKEAMLISSLNSVGSQSKEFNIDLRGFGSFPPRVIYIHIENNVWIGAGAIILPGIHIGSGAVVGAGSVVTKSIQSNCLYAGNPAIKIRQLDET